MSLEGDGDGGGRGRRLIFDGGRRPSNTEECHGCGNRIDPAKTYCPHCGTHERDRRDGRGGEESSRRTAAATRRYESSESPGRDGSRGGQRSSRNDGPDRSERSHRRTDPGDGSGPSRGDGERRERERGGHRRDRGGGRPTPAADEEFCIACGEVIAVDAPTCPACGVDRAGSATSTAPSTAGGAAAGSGGATNDGAGASGAGLQGAGRSQGAGASGGVGGSLEATDGTAGSTNWSGAETGGGLGLGSNVGGISGDSVANLDALATTLDERWRIPIVGVDVGLDPLIGLIPGVGDIITLFISSYIVLKGILLGAPSSVLAKMTAALLAEALIGYVPVVGDAIDFLWSINVNNVERLKASRSELTGSPNYGFLVVGFVGPAVAVFAVIALAFTWLASLLGGI